VQCSAIYLIVSSYCTVLCIYSVLSSLLRKGKGKGKACTRYAALRTLLGTN